MKFVRFIGWLFLDIPNKTTMKIYLNMLADTDSLIPAELKTKVEGGLILIRGNLGLTGPATAKSCIWVI